MNKLLIRTLTVLIAAAAIGGLIAAGKPDVTKARLERTILTVYPNLYLQHAQILGYPGFTKADMGTKVACKRGGPKTKDEGPGSDWRCFIDYNDEKGMHQHALMEVTAKSNGCLVATAPSAIVGLLRLTDTHGRNVLNPVFEYDACYDPAS
jgi:hypothetical protein